MTALINKQRSPYQPADKVYAVIGYDHRGCNYRYQNLKTVLSHYAADKQVQVLLVTNIADDVNSWELPNTTAIQHQQQGAYSHNETLLIGLLHTPDEAIVAFLDADIIFIEGSLRSSLRYVDEYKFIAPLGVMHTTTSDGNLDGACIPAGNVIARKELFIELVAETGGINVRGWGAEDVALLIAARKRNILPKRHYVETLHLWHPEAPKTSEQHVLDKVCGNLSLPAMSTKDFRLQALQAIEKPTGYYNAMRGLGSAHYLTELCATAQPLEIHLLSDGKNDFLGQIHYAGVHIHDDSLPCEFCANSDAIGKSIWQGHEEIADRIQSEKRNVLYNLWYATVALGWSEDSWLKTEELAYGNNEDLRILESLAHRGLALALSGLKINADVNNSFTLKEIA